MTPTSQCFDVHVHFDRAERKIYLILERLINVDRL